MQIRGIGMFDGKIIVGTMLTASAVASTWIEQANEYATLALTGGGIVVAIVTVWYTVLRIRQIRKDK